MNFVKKRIKKSGKTTYQIAKEMSSMTSTPINEKMIIDASKNKKDLGNMMNLFLQVTEPNKEIDRLSNLDIFMWAKQTDLKAKRIEFGYNRKELADILDIPQTTLRDMENGKVGKDNKHIMKLRDFYENDLNKKSNEKETKVSKPRQNKELKMYKDWMKNDLERQIKESGKERKDICKDVGIHVSYLSNCIHRGDDMKIVTPQLRRLYDYFNKEEIVEELKGENVESKEENTNEIDSIHEPLLSQLINYKDNSLKLNDETLNKVVDILIESSTSLLKEEDLWKVIPKAELITRQMELLNAFIENNK